MTATARIAGIVAAVAMLAAILAAPALRLEESNRSPRPLSTTQAGGHPDIETTFRLAEPGVEEAARNVVFKAPEGVFGNPRAIDALHLARLRPDAVPAVNSQAGLITIQANYEGDPDNLLGTAPLYDMDPRDTQTARFGFIVPTLNIPITIPVTVRTGERLRPALHRRRNHPADPARRAKMIFWGFPAEDGTTPSASPKAPRATRPAARAEEGTGCMPGPTTRRFRSSR